MSKYKIITDYTNYPEDKLNSTALSGIEGLTGNTSFTFIHGELINATADQSEYQKALSEVSTGNKEAVTDKNKAKVALVGTLSTLCSQTNVQAGGDKGKLQSTGFPLAKEAEHQVMGDVFNFKVKNAAKAGSIDLSVDKPTTYTDHGTVFAYWDPALGATPADIDNWFHRSCNGHSLTISGLVPGTTYPFASAYKGSDDDDLIWSAIISKMAGD